MVDGFCFEEVAPFPKSHTQAVGLPVDWSWKLTTMGEHPEVISEVKLAVTDPCAKAPYLSTTRHIIKAALSFKMVGLNGG